MPRYERKVFFAGISIGFTTFAVLFLEHLRRFCVNWKYGSKDTRENVNSSALKFGLLHYLFYF